MSKKRDEQAESKAAKERLKKFCRPASECKNRHDPERMAAAKEGREYVTWRELGRKLRMM